MIDCAEGLDRGFSDFFGGCGLGDVAIDKSEVGQRHYAGRGDAARGCDDVIAATEKCLDDGGSDASRSSGHDDSFVIWHSQFPLSLVTLSGVCLNRGAIPAIEATVASD